MTKGRGQVTLDLFGARGGAAIAPGYADVTLAQLFAEVLTAGPLSRVELSRRTGLSQSTVTKAVNPLIEVGYMVETGAKSTGMGRPQRLLRVAADRHAAIGLKVAPRRITAVLANLEANPYERLTRRLGARHRPEAVLAAAAEMVQELLDGDPGVRERLLGIGVGLGGHVDSGKGLCVHSGMLGWDDVPVRDILSAATGVPVVVNNDVNALVIAEQWFGVGRGTSSFAVITVGPGIGGGLLLGGVLHTGSTGLAGEIGHMPLLPDGPRCSCGNQGCLEAITSDAAVLRDIAARGGARYTTIERAVRAGRAGDPAAVAAFEARGEALGRGLATICNLLNLEKIVLTGEGAAAFDLFGPACERSMLAHGFSTAARDCKLVVDDDADDFLWARGAASLVIQEAVEKPLSKPRAS